MTASARLQAAIVAAVERLRRQRLSGPAIARERSLARSTVGAVLRRFGLGRLSVLEPKPPAIRYERERPGELIHIDIKKLGRIDGAGHSFRLKDWNDYDAANVAMVAATMPLMTAAQ